MIVQTTVREEKRRATHLSLGRLHVAVASRYPAVTSRLLDVLAELRLQYRFLKSADACWSSGLPQEPGLVLCVGSEVAVAHPAFEAPTVVITHGIPVPDHMAAKLAQSQLRTLQASAVEPRTLMDAILGAVIGTSKGLGPMSVCEHPRLRQLPPALIRGFWLAPPRLKRLHDIQNVLGVSRQRARSLVRTAGFLRAEHLLTVLREVCREWLLQQGVGAKICDSYLDIRDHSAFLRSLRRASAVAEPR